MFLGKVYTITNWESGKGNVELESKEGDKSWTHIFVTYRDLGGKKDITALKSLKGESVKYDLIKDYSKANNNFR